MSHRGVMRVAFGWTFAGLVAGVAGYQACRLAAAPSRDRARVAHLVMCLGMVASFVPIGWPVPRVVPLAVYVTAAGWCLLDRGAGAHRLHAVTGSLAMAYMFAIPGMPMGGMAGAGMVVSAGGAYAWTSAALAAYFVAETAWCGRSVLATGCAGTLAARMDAACQMAVGTVMTYMLLLAS